MKLFCDETRRHESTVTIDGVEYWDCLQFANLTNRKPGAIRLLATKGNRIRILKGKHINGRLYIEAQELMEFPFVTCGRPYELGDFVEQFYIHTDGETVLKEEKLLKREDKVEANSVGE